MAILGDLVTRFTADLSGLKAGIAEYGTELKKAEKENANFSAGFERITTVAANFAAGVAIGVAAVTALTAKAAAYGDAIKDVGAETGMSIEQVQRWKAAAVAVDVPFESMIQVMRMMTQRLKDADKPTSDMALALKAIGVSARDANGNLKDTDTVTREIILGLSKVSAGADRNALSMAIFGRSWSQIAPMIENATDAMDAYSKKTPFTDAEINRMDKTKAALTSIGDTMDIIATRLGNRFGPLFDAIADGLETVDGLISGIDKKMSDWGRKQEGDIGNLVKFIQNPMGGLSQYTSARDTNERGQAYLKEQAEKKAKGQVGGPDPYAGMTPEQAERAYTETVTIPEKEAVLAVAMKSGTAQEIAAASLDLLRTRQQLLEDEVKTQEDLTDAAREYKNAISDTIAEKQRMQDLERGYQRELSILNPRDIAAARNLITRHQWDVEDQQIRIDRSQQNLAAMGGAGRGQDAGAFSLNIQNVNLSKDYPVDKMIRDYEEYFRKSAYQQGV